MATSAGPSTGFKQDMPPKGGYPKINYTRLIPKQRFSGMTVIIGGLSMMAAGFAVVGHSNRARR